MTSSVNTTAQEIIKHFTDIKESVGQTSQNSSEISVATQQQKSASEQIVLTLKDVKEVTKIQAEELKKSSEELENLNSLALKLQLQTQQAIIDSTLSLAYQVRSIASEEKIYRMDKSQHKQMYQQVMDDNQFIELIYIASKHAKLVSWHSRSETADGPTVLRVGNDCSDRVWFTEANNSRKPYISEVYKSLVSDENCFSVSVGIFNENNDFSGVLTIDINSNEWNKIKYK